MLALAGAALLIAGGAGSYVTWTATATDTATPETNRYTPTIPAVNIDSLYAAKANEEVAIDSADRVALQPNRSISGRISWYGPGFHGRRTASGERFDKHEMTAAHKTLPFGTLVRVIDMATGRSVLVRVNDRGPYAHGRILDLSEAAAQRLGMKGRGTATTRAEIHPLPKNGELLSFDIDGVAYELRGCGVLLRETASYDEAIALQHRLIDQGRENVYLTQTRRDGRILYRVTVGLFATENLCGTLLAELNQSFPEANIIRYSADRQEQVATATKKTDDGRDL